MEVNGNRTHKATAGLYGIIVAVLITHHVMKACRGVEVKPLMICQILRSSKPPLSLMFFLNAYYDID
jgi:hypothetical protein